MKLSKAIFTLLVLATVSFYSCSSKSSGKNYFSEAGLKVPSSSNSVLNKLLTEFPNLYNDLSAAVEKDDKGAIPELTNAYANWLIQVIELKDGLPEDEKKQLTTELETINAKWTEQIDKLL